MKEVIFKYSGEKKEATKAIPYISTAIYFVFIVVCIYLLFIKGTIFKIVMLPIASSVNFEVIEFIALVYIILFILYNIIMEKVFTFVKGSYFKLSDDKFQYFEKQLIRGIQGKEFYTYTFVDIKDYKYKNNKFTIKGTIDVRGDLVKKSVKKLKIEAEYTDIYKIISILDGMKNKHSLVSIYEQNIKKED